MKTCPICLDSIAADIVECPSCGHRFQSAGLGEGISSISRKEKNSRGLSKIKLTLLVGSVLGIVVSVLLIFLFLSNFGKKESENTNSNTANENHSSSKNANRDQVDRVGLRASNIESSLIGAGICTVSVTQQQFGNLQTDWANDYVRQCLIESSGALGTKIVTIYTGESLPGFYSKVDSLKVNELAIYAEGWTVVTNYYPVENKTYFEDPDVERLLDLLGGSVTAKN